VPKLARLPLVTVSRRRHGSRERVGQPEEWFLFGSRARVAEVVADPVRALASNCQASMLGVERLVAVLEHDVEATAFAKFPQESLEAMSASFRLTWNGRVLGSLVIPSRLGGQLVRTRIPASGFDLKSC
jgi:hypothetical protein